MVIRKEGSTFAPFFVFIHSCPESIYTKNVSGMQILFKFMELIKITSYKLTALTNELTNATIDSKSRKPIKLDG